MSGCHEEKKSCYSPRIGFCPLPTGKRAVSVKKNLHSFILTRHRTKRRSNTTDDERKASRKTLAGKKHYTRRQIAPHVHKLCILCSANLFFQDFLHPRSRNILFCAHYNPAVAVNYLENKAPERTTSPNMSPSFDACRVSSRMVDTHYGVASQDRSSDRIIGDDGRGLVIFSWEFCVMAAVQMTSPIRNRGHFFGGSSQR